MSERCCPATHTGLRPLGDCTTYFSCLNGVPVDGTSQCNDGLLFDETIQACNWPNLVAECKAGPCIETATPTVSPTTSPPTATPTFVPTSPHPSAAPSDIASSSPTFEPTFSPTLEPKACCPPGYSGSRAVAVTDCTTYYTCVAGNVVDAPFAKCAPGLRFDEQLQGCNWANTVGCQADPCTSTSTTGYPTPSPTSSLAPTPPGTKRPTSTPNNAPTFAPTHEGQLCCPDGYTGNRAFDDCTKYYTCSNGVLTTGILTMCTPGLLFDQERQLCDWANLVPECRVDLCVPTVSPTQNPTVTPTTASPTISPTTISPTGAPSTLAPVTSAPTTSVPTSRPSKSQAPSAPATALPTESPTTFVPRQCCPPGFSGQRAFDGCTKYYQCLDGEITGVTQLCEAGLLFDSATQNCNWAESVQECKVDVCGPTTAPTMSPSTDKPSRGPTEQPSVSQVPTITTAPSSLHAPSMTPTEIPEPTAQPTAAPTGYPTRKPVTAWPTWNPTMYVTDADTESPVEAEGGQPVRSPNDPDFFDVGVSSAGIVSSRSLAGRFLAVTLLLSLCWS